MMSRSNTSRTVTLPRVTFIVNQGDRIAQIIFEEIAYPRMVTKDALDLCDLRRISREDKGFGSTGTASKQQGRDSDPDLTPSNNIIAILEGPGRYGGSSRPSPNRRTYPPMSREERIQLSQTEPSHRWIDPTFHPLAADYQATLQQYEDHLTYDSGLSFNEFAEIQERLSIAEDDAIQQTRTAMQQLVKIQQLKLEAFARMSVSDNTYSDNISTVHQQNQELKEIDGELFDVIMLMRLYRI